MADQQRRVSLIFDADSSRAKKQIDELANSINKVMNIGTRSFGMGSIDKELRNAAQSAAILQNQLKEAVNVKTGKLDLTKFNEAIKRGGIGLDEYQKTLSSMGSVGEQAFTNLARSIATAEIPLRRTNTLLNDFAVTMKNTVKWQLSSSLMHGFLSSMQSAMSYAQHLNQNLTDIRIVTGQSAEEMARFAEQANKSAKELSTTTNQYAQAALIFYQQGLNDKAVKERTDAVIKMANVTGEAAKDVSSYMTAIWNNFDDGSKTIEYYADVITKLGAATAASSEEIAGGLEKFAAVGNTIGLSYEYATAMLTTIIDKTRQSEDVVGTALKTILARIQGLNLGETLDDGTTLNKYSSALASVGVQIKDASGQLRDMDAILNDLGGKWQSLSKDTQVALAQVVGGVRQYNQILSLMDNWDAFEMNLDIAFNAEGSLNEQAEIYAESWEAAQNRVQAAMESIYSSLIDDKFFIGFNNVLAEGIGVIESFIQNLGGLKGTVATLGTVFITVFGNQLTGLLKDATYNLKMMTKSGKDEIIAAKKQAQELLSIQSADKATRGGSAAGDAYKKEAASQILLLNNAKKLSAAEEEIANTLMRQIQLRTDQQVAAGMAADLAERELERQEKIVQRYLEQKNLKVDNIDVSQLSRDLSEINQALPQLSSLDDIFLNIVNSGENAELQLSDLKNMINSFSVSSLPEGIGQEFETLVASINASTNFESAKVVWSNFFTSIQDKSIQVTETLEKLRTHLNNLKQQDVVDTDQITQLELLIRMFDELESKAREAGESYDTSNKAQLDAAQANKALEEYLSRVGIQIVSNQQKIVTYAQTFSSLAMVLNQLRGTWDLLNDSQASGMDKLLSMMMTLGTTIPTITSLTKSLVTLGTSKVILYNKTQLVEAGFKGEALAAEIAKHSSVSFGQALKAIAPELIAIGAIFATLTFVIPKVVEWMNKKPKGLADSLKQLKEESQNFDTALSETKTEAKNVQDIFEQYNSVHDALNACEENTREWRDRLQEVKQLESDILADNPQILEFMKLSSSLGYDSAKYTNNSGQLDFSAVLTDYADYLKQQTIGMTLGKIQTEEEISSVDYLTTNFEGRNNYMGDIDWGTMTAYISAGEAGMIPYQMDKGDRVALDEAASGTTFLRDAESMYTDIGGADWAAGLLSEGHTQDSFVRGMAEYIYRWGLQQGYATYEEAAQAYVESLPEEEQADFTTTITSFDGNVQGGTWAEIMQSALGENYHGYTAMYAADASTALNKDITANAFLPSLFSQYDLTSYTPEVQKALSGNFGQAVANSMLNSLDLDSIPLELAISNYERNNGVTLEPLDDDSGNYRSVDAEGNEIASNITTDQIKLSSDMGIQMIRELDLGEHIETALSNIPESLRDYVLSGDFKGYTAEELQNTAVPEEYNPYLAEMYGENYRQTIQDELTSAQAVSNNFSGPAGLTYGNMLEYNALSPAAQAILMDPMVQDSIEDYNAFFDALNTPMGVGAGMESLTAFTSLLREFGVVLEEDSESYQRLSQEMTQGELGISRYEGLTPDILKGAQTLASGGSLTDKELEALTGAGLDINLLQSPGGKDYLSGIASDYSMAAMEAHAAKEEIRYDPETKLYTYDDLEGANIVASAFGYEPVNPEAFSAGNQYGWNEGPLGQEAQEALSAVDFDTISANLATFGIEYAEVIKGFGEEYYNKYLDTMIQAQAELDGIELPEEIYDADDPLQAYQDFVRDLKIDEAITGFIDNYSNNIQSGLMKTLASDTTRLVSENAQLDAFRQQLADMLGMSVEDITDEFILQNWDNIVKLGSNNEADVQAAMTALNPQIDATRKNYADSLVRGLGEDTEAVANYALTVAAEAFANGQDYSDLTTTQLGAAKNQFYNESGELNTEEIDLALKEAGVLNKDGTGFASQEMEDRYGSIENAREAFVDGIVTYYDDLAVAAIENLEDGLADSIEDVTARILSNTGGFAGTYTREDVSNVRTAVSGAQKYGGRDASTQLENILGQAGDKAGLLAAEFANIDWSNVSIDELESIIYDLGLSSTITTDELMGLVSAMDTAIQFTNSLTQALNNYASDTELADKLRAGEDISAEDYARAEAIYGKEQAQDMFSMNANGTYSLAEGYDGSVVASQIEAAIIAGFNNAALQWGDANTYFGNNGTAIGSNESFLSAQSSEQGISATDTALGYISENIGTLFPEVDAEAANQAIGVYQNSGRDSEDLTTLLSAFGVSDISELFTPEVQQGIGRQAEESREAYEDSGTRIQEENEEQAFSDEMTKLNLDKEEVEGLSETLQELAENSKDAELGGEGLSEELMDNEKAAKEVAKELKRYDRALESVEKNQEDWTETLESGNPTDMAKAVGELDEAYSDMLDLDMGSLSQDFLTNADNLELMKEAANGSEEAYEQLQEAAGKDILAQIGVDTDRFNDDKNWIDSALMEIEGKELEDIEVGAALDDADFLQGLTDMVNAAGMTADQATSYLASMGVDAEVIEEPVETEETAATNLVPTMDTVSQDYQVPASDGQGTETVTATAPRVTYDVEPVESTKETKATSLKVVSANKSSGGGFKHNNSSNGGGRGSGGRRGGGGGRRGGGGGRGREAPRGEKKKDSEKERYHSITNVLEDLTDALDKVSKASDRAFGKARIKLLEQQEEALQDLLSAQGTYLEEIEANLEADMDLLESMDFGVELQFDENGTLLNFEDLQNAMWDEYNSHIDENGNVIGMTDEEWKEYEEDWKERMEALAQYEETQDLWKEAKQQLQDYINQIHDIRLEQVTYAVEVDIEASENSLELLDYLLNKIGDSAWDAADAIANMGEQAQEYLGDLVTNEDGSTSFVGGQINTIQGGIAGILGNHTRDIVDEKTGKVLQAASLTDADVQGFMNGDAAAIEKVRQMGLNGTLTDAEVQALKDYHSQLLQANQALMDLRDSVHEKVLEAFQQFNEELQEGIDKIDHLGRMMQSYRNIVDIVGKENLGVSNTMLEAIGQGQVENKIDSLGGQKARVDSLKAMIADAEAKAASATTEEDKKKWQDNIDEMKKELADAEEDFMGSWEEALQSIQEQFELAVSNTIETFSDALAGPLAGSLDELQASFDRQNSLAERFLPEYEKIYELNKLNRDITNSINDTDNVKAKQELAKLQEEINALEAEGTEVSRFQTEDLRRRYELKLAELALEEAKNAKSNVQMARNADGDWSYVYTADEEDVAAAEQNYEDKMFAIQQANAQYINEMQNSLIQAQADMASEIEAIMTDETLSMEEKMQKVNEIKEYYTEMFGFYSDELQYVMDQNGTAFESTTLSALTGFQNLEDYNENFYAATTAMMTDLDEAYAMWKENTDAAMEAAGTSIDGFADHLSEQTQAMVDDSNEARESVENLGQAAVDAFGDITEAVENWVTQYGEKISEILTKNEALATSFRNLLNEWSNFDNKDNQNPAPTEPEPTEPGGDDGGGDENDEPEYMGQITIKKGYQYWGYKSPKGGSKNKVKVVNDDRQERTYKFTQMDTSTSRKRVYIPSEKVWVSSYDPDGPKRIKVEKFDTGGYTGSWGSEGRMAMLHEKEIVLNKADTANLLTAVDMIRQVAKIIDLNAYSSAGFGSSIMGMASGSAGQFEQNVHITAEFPNATDRNEIYAAFTDIVNLASQYANR